VGLRRRVRELEASEPTIHVKDDHDNVFEIHVKDAFTLLSVARQLGMARRDGEANDSVEVPPEVASLVPLLDHGLTEFRPGDGQLVRAASLILESQRLAEEAG